MIKFNRFNVTNGVDRASVRYSLDNRVDERLCVTLYEQGYEGVLGRIFTDDYRNETDLITDYVDKGKVVLFVGNPLYAAARDAAAARIL